jgi:hypothetical protein
MAKRKAAQAGRKRAGVTRKATGRTGAKAKTAAPRRAVKAARKTAGRKTGRKATAAARSGARKAAARKAANPAAATRARRQTAAGGRKQAAPAARRSSPQTAGKRAASPEKKRVPVRRSRRDQGAASQLEGRKAPGLNRERRVINDDDIVQSTPPSSLDLDRTASSARSGRRTLRDRYAEHTETGPALTGGDVDADWESAYSVGDEAPGGDNPTPDQDIVDDIGRAVGVEYQDNEELKGADKVAKRDKNRWELDPASSDDWEDR